MKHYVYIPESNCINIVEVDTNQQYKNGPKFTRAMTDSIQKFTNYVDTDGNKSNRHGMEYACMSSSIKTAFGLRDKSSNFHPLQMVFVNNTRRLIALIHNVEIPLGLSRQQQKDDAYSGPT
jgi:hypothetical protein